MRDGLLLRSSHQVCGHRGRSYDAAGSDARASPVDAACWLVRADTLHRGTSCTHRGPLGLPRRKHTVWPHQWEGSGRSWAGATGSRAERSLCTRGSGCLPGPSPSLCAPGQTEARPCYGGTHRHRGGLHVPLGDRTSQTELSKHREEPGLRDTHTCVQKNLPFMGPGDQTRPCAGRKASIRHFKGQRACTRRHR